MLTTFFDLLERERECVCVCVGGGGCTRARFPTMGVILELKQELVLILLFMP